MWEKHSGKNQKWKFTKEGFIESRLTKELVLDYKVDKNGKKILIANKKDDNNYNKRQKWKIENRMIVNEQLGNVLCIDTTSIEKKATVILGGRAEYSHRQWNVESARGSAYSATNLYSFDSGKSISTKANIL